MKGKKPKLVRCRTTGLTITVGTGQKVTSEDVRRLLDGDAIAALAAQMIDEKDEKKKDAIREQLVRGFYGNAGSQPPLRKITALPDFATRRRRGFKGTLSASTTQKLDHAIAGTVEMPRKQNPKRHGGRGPYSDKAARIWKYRLQVAIAAGQMIVDPFDGKRWLEQPCPQLGGRIPLKVATSKRGTARVLRVLKYWPGPDEGLAHLRQPPPVLMFASRKGRIAWYRTQMIHIAEECLESAAAAKAWVRSSAFALGGRVPWQVCVSKKGLMECVTALRRIDYNIAS